MPIDMTKASAIATEPADRVRKNTSRAVNAAIDRAIAQHVLEYGNQTESVVSQRIQALNREWDTERILEANAAFLATTGLILGAFVDALWLWLAAIVMIFLFQHAVQGWCPPLPLIRRLGVRTRHEIDREKFALKVLRGDFAEVPLDAEAEVRVQAALQAVMK